MQSAAPPWGLLGTGAGPRGPCLQSQPAKTIRHLSSRSAVWQRNDCAVGSLLCSSSQEPARTNRRTREDRRECPDGAEIVALFLAPRTFPQICLRRIAKWLFVFNSNFLRTKEAHRSGAGKRQRFDHPTVGLRTYSRVKIRPRRSQPNVCFSPMN